MPAKDSVSFSLQVPLYWWRRLQRVSKRCHTSPYDFVRESLEAEVVRRELQHEQEEPIEVDWLKMVIDPLLQENNCTETSHLRSSALETRLPLR